MPEKKKQKTYSGEFKIEVVETMRKENLSYKETVRHFGLRSDKQVRMWERIYLEEGKEALLLERRGRACAASGTRKGRKPKLDKQVEEDLIVENQRLRMEIDYLKKLRALVLEEERQNRKHK
jgi:transposase-like protein